VCPVASTGPSFGHLVTPGPRGAAMVATGPSFGHLVTPGLGGPLPARASPAGPRWPPPARGARHGCRASLVATTGPSFGHLDTRALGALPWPPPGPSFGCRALVAATGPRCPPWLPGCPGGHHRARASGISIRGTRAAALVASTGPRRPPWLPGRPGGTSTGPSFGCRALVASTGPSFGCETRHTHSRSTARFVPLASPPSVGSAAPCAWSATLAGPCWARRFWLPRSILGRVQGPRAAFPILQY
jgi:hypothetical protein